MNKAALKRCLITSSKTDARPFLGAGKHQSTIHLLRELFARVDFRLVSFIAPALLSFSAAVFEGISLYLLMPVIQESIRLKFDLIQNSALVKAVNSWSPGVLPTQGSALFALFLALFFLAAVLKIMLAYAATVRCSLLVRRFSDRLRQSLFERCLGFGKLYYDKANVGHLQNVLLASTEVVVGQLANLQEILTWSFMFLVYLSLMLRISIKLTLGVMVVFPIMQLSLRFLSSRIKSASGNLTEARRHLSGYLAGALTNIQLVKSSASEDNEKLRFGQISRKIEELDFDLARKAALIIPIQELIFLLTLLLVLFALTFVGGQSAGLVPSFLVYVYLLRRASTALNVIARVNASLVAIHGPITEVLQLFDDAGKELMRDGGIEFPGLRHGIEAKGLSFTFPHGVRSLDELSFSVEKGKTTAIIGPSGTGKTTLINLILRFYDPPPGTILLDGMDIQEFSLKSLRTKIALISQETLLFNETILKNVTYPITFGVSEDKLWDALKQARLYDYVTKLPRGLDTMIGDRGVQLSGGEKQRVSIARAILKDADILILDEATSSLDSQTETLIQESIEALLKGRTAIVIAHRLSTIKNADKIIVIEKGRVAEQGTLQELLGREGLFRGYWTAQKFD